MSANTTPAASVAVILDVDGTLSAVHPRAGALPWRDEVVVGHLFGPVLVSPTLTARLDALASLPGVRGWWLTSWTPEMRATMTPFPGATWPTIAVPDPATQSRTPRWWKMRAVETWLNTHPEVRALAWCDDDLRGGRQAAARKRLTARGIRSSLLIAPNVSIGLTPVHLRRLEEWVLSAIQNRP